MNVFEQIQKKYKLNYDPMEAARKHKLDPEKVAKEHKAFTKEKEKRAFDLGDNPLAVRESEMVLTYANSKTYYAVTTILYYDKEWIYALLKNKKVVKLPQGFPVRYVYSNKPDFVREDLGETTGYIGGDDEDQS